MTVEIDKTQNFHIEVQDELDKIIVLDQDQGKAIIHVRGQGRLNLNVEVLKGVWDILVIHTGDHDLAIEETLLIQKDADVTLSYGQFASGKVVKHSHYQLEGEGASLHTLGAVLSNHELKWVLQSNHVARNTFASLATNVVIGDQGVCNIEVIGSIPKGYSGSKTHQMTKMLNLGEHSTAMVYPKLLIDENDVEASHAASVGQPEEEHIYYLMSRGLSHQEAMQLLIKGYLHPVVDRIEDQDLKDQLLSLIDTEVAAYE